MWICCIYTYRERFENWDGATFQILQPARWRSLWGQSSLPIAPSRRPTLVLWMPHSSTLHTLISGRKQSNMFSTVERCWRSHQCRRMTLAYITATSTRPALEGRKKLQWHLLWCLYMVSSYIVCNLQVCSEHLTLCSLTDLFNWTSPRLRLEVRIIWSEWCFAYQTWKCFTVEFLWKEAVLC